MKTDVEDIINRYKEANPYECQYLGIQSTYGKSKSYAPESIKNRISELRRDIDVLQSLLEVNLELKNTKIELEAIKFRLKNELFELEEEQEYKSSPEIYFSALRGIQTIYVSRAYAPLEKRIRHIIETEESLTQNLQEGYKQLHKIMPRAKIEFALLVGKGLLAYLQDELLEDLLKVNNKDLIEEWSQTNNKAIEALKEYLKRLTEEYLPKSTKEFALGEGKYLKKLEKSEGVKLSAKRLLEIAEKDLENNYNKLIGIKQRIGDEEFTRLKEEAPTEEQLLQTAENIIKNTKEFVREKDLVSIPVVEECIVRETPKAMRSVVLAAMNTANIAEESEAKESYYYVTPPDQTWTEEQKTGYLKTFNRGSLEIITAHEVYPGHYLHMQQIRKLSPILRLFRYAITMTEGWAHYTEELLIEKGYDKIEKTQAEIGQLLAALQRNCRFVASVKMHCQEMTMEEAKKLFMEKALAPEKMAEMEARRGTINPMYLNYTLGKLIIKKLREDYKKEQGEKFVLKEFHDRLLSYGGIPLPIIRKDMLKNPGGEKDIL